MNVKYLVDKGCAGLGNRLITLLSAIDYARKTGRRLHVDWSDGMFGPKGQNVFYRYFELSKEVDSEESMAVIEKAVLNGASTYPAALTPGQLKGNIYSHFDTVGPFMAATIKPCKVAASLIARGKTASLLGLQMWQPLTDKVKSWRHNIANTFNSRNFPLGSMLPAGLKEQIALFADFRPYVNPRRIFKYVNLRVEYEAKFKAFADEHSLWDNGIGVHVRATDKQPGAGYDRLHRILGKVIAGKSDARIFLSTDNKQIEDDFRSRYGQRLVTYPKFTPPQSGSIGIHQWALWHGDEELKSALFEESLADMWILSYCRQLFWQGNSSFSLISKELKNDPSSTRNWLSL